MSGRSGDLDFALGKGENSTLLPCPLMPTVL